ncbi:MAG TPA: ABC transporter ATP-binding protein [Mycobacteriales bacterium]|nr:ABC transporter ATP-binding protein [Mycobacteriales bacterium]
MLVRLIREFLRPHRRQLGILVVLQAVQALANLYLPTLNADLINHGVLVHDLPHIWHVGGLMLAVSVVQLGFTLAAVLTASRLAMSFGRDVRSALFHRVTGYSARELNGFGAPSLINRITNDVQQVQMLVVFLCTLVLSAPVTAVGGIVLAMREDRGLSALLALSIPVLGLAMTVVIRRLVPQFRRLQTEIDAINRVLREQLTGIRVVRAFVREPEERARFDDANRDLTRTAMAAGRLMSLMFPLLMLVINGSSVVLIWWGGSRVAHGQTSVGSLIAFISYFTLILMSVLMASFAAVMAPRASVSAERILEVLDTATSVVPPAHPVSAMTEPGTVELRDVTFGYPGADVPVLAHLDARVGPGTVLAVVGSTGSGKTSLVNLVARLFDVTGGAVLVGGVDVRELDPDVLWNRVGMVPQKPFLFSGTIRSNLQHGKADATDDECWEALDVAQAGDFVRQMPGGLDARVEQGGTNLSGGQRQRMAIARAVVRRPDVYLFDDCFSALDASTDARLRAALTPWTRDAAVIVVAQRVATIRGADQILVLQDGGIVGLGPHEELLKTCATYREIVDSQELTRSGA